MSLNQVTEDYDSDQTLSCDEDLDETLPYTHENETETEEANVYRVGWSADAEMDVTSESESEISEPSVLFTHVFRPEIESAPSNDEQVEVVEIAPTITETVPVSESILDT